MWQDLQRQLGDAFARLLEAFLAVIPAIAVLLASLLVGAVAGTLLRIVLRAVLRAARRNGDEKNRSSAFLRAAGLKASPEAFAGTVSFWTTVVVALAVGVNALQPGALRNVLGDVVGFLPRILMAALLVLLGLGVAAIMSRSVLLGAVNAGIPWARTGARAVHGLVVAFFVAVALDHLGVGRAILVAAFSIGGGGIVLALALAFGLGARDLARGYLERRLRDETDDTGIRHV